MLAFQTLSGGAGLNLEMSVTEIGVTEFLPGTNDGLFRQEQEPTLHQSPPCGPRLTLMLLCAGGSGAEVK